MCSMYSMIAKIQNIHVFNLLYDIKCVHLNLFSSDFSKKDSSESSAVVKRFNTYILCRCVQKKKYLHRVKCKCD